MAAENFKIIAGDQDSKVILHVPHSATFIPDDLRKNILLSDQELKAELDEILYNTAESLRALAVLLHPVMPEVTTKLWVSLGAQEKLGDISTQRIDKVANWGQLPAGSTVTKTDVLFPRLEEAK